MHLNRRSLEWITHNRRLRLRSRAIGESAAVVFKRLEQAIERASTGLEKDLRSLVDEDFRQRCTAVGIKNDVLILGMDDARMLVPMRLRWALELLEGVGRVRPDLKLRRVRFVYRASGGHNVPRPMFP